MIEAYCDDAVEVIGAASHAGMVLSAEHACNILPVGWKWPAEDEWIRDTHWAFDLGVEELVRAMAQRLGAPAVLARYSRLLVDPNRIASSDTLFRALADGKPVRFNVGLSNDERQRRIADYHEPYHVRLDGVMASSPSAAIVSVHSFTPVYESQPPRKMEIGVLFDHDERQALTIANYLSERGWKVALNEPYSGKDGLMYSAHRHARAHDRVAIEFEIRQDVATDPTRFDALVGDLSDALEFGLRPSARLPCESS